jgi:hypothetical protein
VGGGGGGGRGLPGRGPQLIIFHPPGVLTNWDRVTGLAMPGSSSSNSERRRPSLQILYAVDRVTQMPPGLSSLHSVRRRLRTWVLVTGSRNSHVIGLIPV